MADEHIACERRAYTQPPNVLIFSKTSSYRHTSILASISALHSLAKSTNAFTTEASEDAETTFTPSSIARFQVIILLQCSGDFLIPIQLDVLKKFVRDGGGVVAIHGAAAGLPKDDWYGALIGAHFDSHPDPEPGTLLFDEDVVEELSSRNAWKSPTREGWMDEWYNFRTHPRANTNLKVLLKGDAKSFQGGKMGDDHPLSWYQEFEGGRVWYTALGHFDEAYSDSWFMEQILQAVLWAAG
ncbi:glycosyl hydrolase [Melanomma pulvis-pyrius CBS 109.77]|uniref:Glycosyl hydrolase n=1 Tax=Melanomma pulvis-pyrius CBS 109.77 TaxID=1314802 RepID=A0A6A6WWR1_9PLEO|nr:glycosyl hydrolase [Melanomma pulvis-pyrius CBS 109.77]